MTNTEVSPFNSVFENTLASKSATTIPKTYKLNTTNAFCSTKNAPTNKAYTGRRAEQDINGVKRIVINLSFGVSIVLAAIIPGTLQPNPIIIGINAFPFSPTDSIMRSITSATRAIYPESSSSDIKKNKMKICGTNTSTPPTPATIPSRIRSLMKGAAPAAASAPAIPDVTGPDKSESKTSDNGKPSQSKVSMNMTYINNKKIGIPRNLFVTIISTFSVNGTFRCSFFELEAERILFIVS